MNVLDALLFGIRNIFFAGSEMPTRSAINVHGAGVTVTDDVANERTDIEIPGAGPGAGLTLTAVKTAYYEAAVGELVQVDATAGDITIVAPLNASGHTDERWGVLRVEPTLPVSHTVTINADDGVNGEGSYLMPIARQVVIMRSDGSTWRVEGTYQATEFAPVAAALAAADADIDVNAQKITNLADPTTDQDAATKAYVDANVGGGGGWQTGYEQADFGSLVPASIIDGANTIAGKAWTATNSGSAAYLAVDSDGITGQANSGASNVMLSIPWATLAPAATLADHDVLIIARLVLSAYSGVDTSSGLCMAFGFEPFSAGSDGGSGLPSKALLATCDTQGGDGLRNITQTYGLTNSQQAVLKAPDVATDVFLALHLSAGGRRVVGMRAAGGATFPDASDMVQIMSANETFNTTTLSGMWTPSSSHIRLRWYDNGGGSKWSLRALKVVYK